MRLGTPYQFADSLTSPARGEDLRTGTSSPLLRHEPPQEKVTFPEYPACTSNPGLSMFNPSEIFLPDRPTLTNERKPGQLEGP